MLLKTGCRLRRLPLCGAAAALPLVLLFGMPASCGQADGTASDSGITHEQADQILQELKSIRQLLERLEPPPLAGKLKLDGEPARGSEKAPVAIVEFVDYQCPYCRLAESEIVPELVKKYIEPGIVRLYIHDDPLDSHPEAFAAAEAANCAADQGKFWQMHKALFSDSPGFDLAGLFARGEAAGLEMRPYGICLASHSRKEAVERHVRTAKDFPITSLPAFLIGRQTGDTVSGTFLAGAQQLAAFEILIQKNLESH